MLRHRPCRSGTAEGLPHQALGVVRLDVFSSLLLAPHLDALFDGGWVSFDDAGELLVSSMLPHEALGLFHLQHHVVSIT